jgi:hypothetical protein
VFRGVLPRVIDASDQTFGEFVDILEGLGGDLHIGNIFLDKLELGLLLKDLPIAQINLVTDHNDLTVHRRVLPETGHPGADVFKGGAA